MNSFKAICYIYESLVTDRLWTLGMQLIWEIERVLLTTVVRFLCKIARLRTLTHWGRVTHIFVSKLTIIDSDNGFSPDRRQAIIWTNAGLLFVGPLGTNVSKILIKILTFAFKKMRLKVSSAKRRSFCLGLNVLRFQNEAIKLLGARCVMIHGLRPLYINAYNP